jgi:methionine sulfoxide reductase heme-binding subunit
MQDVKFNKLLISLNAFVPLLMISFDGFRGNLGANPVEFFLRTTGVLTLVFLTITLSVTPLRKLFGWNGLMKYRRMLGLYSFFYGALHLSTYSIFDKSLNLGAILSDVYQRPFIAIGMLSFFLMIPLAVTSTNSMIKKLGGKSWVKLHRLTYLVLVGGILHFYMIVKSDITYPAIFAAIGAILLGFRVYESFATKKTISAQRRASQKKLLRRFIE